MDHGTIGHVGRPCGESRPLAFIHGPGLILGRSSQEYAVLVDIVKSVKPPEVVVPTLVRPDRVDAVSSILPQSVYLSSLAVEVAIGTVEDWETCLRARFRERAPNQEKLVNQVIQCRSAIVNHIADQDADADRNLPNTPRVIDQLSRSRIALGSDYVWSGSANPGTQEPINCAIQFGEMVFGSS
jgi:hypothetical protein